MPPWGQTPGIITLTLIVIGVVWLAFQAGRKAASNKAPTTGEGFEVIIAQCPQGHRCMGWTSWTEHERALTYGPWFTEHSATCKSLPTDNKTLSQNAPGG